MTERLLHSAEQREHFIFFYLSIACKKDNHSQSCLYMERDFRDSRSLLLAGAAQAPRKGKKG